MVTLSCGLKGIASRSMVRPASYTARSCSRCTSLLRIGFGITPLPYTYTHGKRTKHEALRIMYITCMGGMA